MKNAKRRQSPQRGLSPFRTGTVPFSVPLSLLLLLTLLLTACSSPEANRVRGGGPGADIGNRSGAIETHAGSAPYWQTPKLIGGETPPLEMAQHARQGTRG